MACNPSTNNINIPSPGIGPSLPGLGLPFSVPKVDFPDFGIPEGVPEDLLELLNTIIARLPAGIKLVPNSDSAMKGIWDALASLFNQMAPFLAVFKFIQALLNMVMCIIDVICALMNPWALMKAVKRLFKVCIPDFLSMFPQFALIVMILTLLLLLIALIEYLYNVIKSYIEQIIKNLKVLSRAIQVSDEQSILAATNKLAYLLCLIEQLFSMLLAVAALFAVIEPLMKLAGRGVCSKSSGSSCCEDDDFCPPFIANSPSGLLGNTGVLVYHPKIDVSWPINGSLDFLKNSGITPQREELWQFVDSNPGLYKFLDIITPSEKMGFIYWPEGNEYSNDANINKVPYLLDISFYANTRSFGVADNTGTHRFLITDIVVIKKPTPYPTTYDKGLNNAVSSGTLTLGGGKVWQYTPDGDGYLIYNVNGSQATLNTFMHSNVISNVMPSVDDGYHISNIEYNLKINHASLVDNKLITLMCVPDNAVESAVVNAEYADVRSVFDKMGDLPDINSTITCLNTALTTFRKNLNEETAAVFESEVKACLDTLKAAVVDSYGTGTEATSDRFASNFEIDPDLQFINRDINVTIRLKDKTGTILAENIPKEIGDRLAKLITLKPTLGQVSDVIYDGYESFTSKLTSKTAGIGEIKAFLNNEPFATIINRDKPEESTAIIDRVLSYEFVDQTTKTYRRDQGDKFKTNFDQSDIGDDVG